MPKSKLPKDIQAVNLQFQAMDRVLLIKGNHERYIMTCKAVQQNDNAMEIACKIEKLFLLLYEEVGKDL